MSKPSYSGVNRWAVEELRVETEVAGGSCGQARREELDIQPMVKLCHRNKKEAEGSPELVKSSIVVEVRKPELLLLLSPTPVVVGGFTGQLLPSTRKREEESHLHLHRRPRERGRGADGCWSRPKRERRETKATTILGCYDKNVLQLNGEITLILTVD
nr:hypothetical protein Iba_chr03dCG2890 [Ipomoea batatas]